MASLSTLQKTLGITFKDLSLLKNAFIHRSYLNETKGKNLESNERLEFLGDAVLELSTSNYLFQKLPHKPEGELTSLRASLVKTETLAAVAQKLHLGQYLKMSHGELRSGGRENKSLLANTVEALLGAIYLDQGFATAEKFTHKYLFHLLPNILKNNLHHDFKSTFQEVVQAQGFDTPTYRLVKQEGPDHDKTFTVKVIVDNQTKGIGRGSSKQKAEAAAAKAALEKLEKK